MSLSNGDAANATVFNAAFASKTDDNILVGTQTLDNGGSTQVADLQQTINDLSAEFDTATGHDHDGSNSRVVSATNLADKSTNMVQSIYGPDGQYRGDVTLAAGSGMIIDGDIGTETMTIRKDGLPSSLYTGAAVTLADNQSSSALLFANSVAVNIGYIMTVSVKRGTNYMGGTITIISNGTTGEGNTDIFLDLKEVGDCGITFTADLQTLVGVDCACLNYTSTNTGTAGKILMDVKYLTIPV